MPALNQFNLGKDCSVVLQGPFGQVQLSLVTEFKARQLTHKVKSHPLNVPPLQADVPAGWEVTFEVDRANSNADDLAVLIESNFWVSGSIGVTTLYQYVSEVAGSTSTYVFSNGTLTLEDAGDWKIDATAKQRITAFFSTRQKQ